MDDDTFAGLLADLASAPDRIDAVIWSVTAGAWGELIQTGDGAWTRRELLAHMAANDLRQLVRIRIGAGIAEPGDEAAHAADLAVHEWNQARVEERAGRTVGDLVAEMRANRKALIALVGSLTPEQRARPMPFRGEPTPLEEMVPVLIGHLDQHAGELVQ